MENSEQRDHPVNYVVKPDDFVDVNSGPIQESLGDAPKSLLMSLIKQVKIGMDLTKIPLPTFVLEPKSMLEKFGDFMSHGDHLVSVPGMASPEERMIGMLRWFISGFYLRPKGVKKPYNPVLGELHRSMWDHNGSRSYLVAEQVSHHPPVSAFYCQNRKAGFVANGCVQFRSKFLGNSAASVLDGTMSIFILPHNEEYVISFPDAYVRGIIMGTILMEYCGEVSIVCEATGYKTTIEFKAKPFFGGDYYCLDGKITKAGKTLYSVSGKWDTSVEITNPKTKESRILWEVAGQRGKRLPRYTVKLDEQLPNESERLWHGVSEALKAEDQKTATDEKTAVENAQREAVKQREKDGSKHSPLVFVPAEALPERKWKQNWVYKHINVSPFDPKEEDVEKELNFVISSKK